MNDFWFFGQDLFEMVILNVNVTELAILPSTDL